jgi:hypothetical protein
MDLVNNFLEFSEIEKVIVHTYVYAIIFKNSNFGNSRIVVITPSIKKEFFDAEKIWTSVKAHDFQNIDSDNNIRNLISQNFDNFEINETDFEFTLDYFVISR